MDEGDREDVPLAAFFEGVIGAWRIESRQWERSVEEAGPCFQVATGPD